jgi:hypothetical protein
LFFRRGAVAGKVFGDEKNHHSGPERECMDGGREDGVVVFGLFILGEDIYIIFSHPSLCISLLFGSPIGSRDGG